MLIRVAGPSLEQFHDQLRRLTQCTRSGQMEHLIQTINTYTMGSIGYCWQANAPSVYEELD